MSTTITRVLADDYFDQDSHINFELWNSFDDEQKDGAVAHAIRQVTREIGSSIESETVSTGASYRPDYAVYEQSLYLLVNSDAVADGTQTGPKYYGDDGGGQERERAKLSDICEESQKWLDVRSGASVSILRG